MAETKKRLIANFMSLGLQQGIAIVFPLLTMPYLVRVLGLSNFGVFTMIQTAILYFDLLIAFGFNLTATQRIAKANEDTAIQQKIIATVYLIKLLLLIISLIIFLIAAIFIPYLQQNITLLFWSALYLLGNALFPDWFFMGIQQMKNCTLVTLISRLISLILIVVLVKQSIDIDKAFLALAAGNLLAGIVGFVLLYNKIKFAFKIPEKLFVQQVVKESGYVFVSIILAPFYSSVNIFILKFFADPLIVGSYAVAQKIFAAASMFTSVLNNTFFPHLSKLYSLSIAAYKKNIRTILLFMAIGFFIAAVLQYFLAPYIITILAGDKENISYAVLLLRIMSIGLFFSPFVSFFFQQMIIQGQQQKAISNIVITVMVNLISAFVLGYWYSGTGMAINVCFIVVLIGYLNTQSVNKKVKLFAN